MIDYKEIMNFYNGKNVLVTGNTGFKGSWLVEILLMAGANVVGYSLEPSTFPSLFNVLKHEENEKFKQYYSDVRNLDSLKEVFSSSKPDVVLHLAAQPIVRESYRKPVDTYSTNVMGTVNVCECVRLSTIPVSEGGIGGNGWKGVVSFVNVTTDKVYKNNEWEYGYRENDPLDGYDPYSNSKSCSELVTHSYRDSFFRNGSDGYSVAISTARAGNVIGGGDFSEDRIIPDCVRSVLNSKESGKKCEVIIRNPNSTRPYQHVLEPLFLYLLIAKEQYNNPTLYSDNYNVGPDDCDCVTTGNLVNLFCRLWNNNKNSLPEFMWTVKTEANAPHEANFLKLDSSRVKNKFGWQPRWHIEDAVYQTVMWTKAWLEGSDVKKETDREIVEFITK